MKGHIKNEKQRGKRRKIAHDTPPLGTQLRGRTKGTICMRKWCQTLQPRRAWESSLNASVIEA